MSAVDDLITWLRAQLDEDGRKIAAMEREEHRVQTAPIFQSYPPNWLAGVDIFVSPRRWRAEVEAKRRILDEHQPDANGECGTCREPGLDRNQHWPCMTVRLLAQPYAAQPGWREEWAA